jgi:hypothetical protein
MIKFLLICWVAVFMVPLDAVSGKSEWQEPLVLAIEPLNFTPEEFYIAEVVDERKDPSAVAWLIPPGSGSGPTQPLDFKGGGKAAIEAFMLKSLPRNKKLRPIIVRIKECRLIEIPGSTRVVQGELKVHLSFDLQKEKGPVHLVDYNGGMKYRRSANQRAGVEAGLRRSLGNGLEYLHQWMNKQVSTHEALASGVKVFFEDQTQNMDNDTVFYDPDRPLRWEDFRGRPQPGGKFSASVFSSFAWEGNSEVVNGIIHLYLKTKVYMLKSSSWVREGNKNPYALNHEQRHFDIVKIIMERFKVKLQAMNLSPDDYEGILGYQYLEVYREMNRLQDEYDGETRHGINKTAQEQWNQRIDRELREFGVKE